MKQLPKAWGTWNSSAHHLKITILMGFDQPTSGIPSPDPFSLAQTHCDLVPISTFTKRLETNQTDPIGPSQSFYVTRNGLVILIGKLRSTEHLVDKNSEPCFLGHMNCLWRLTRYLWDESFCVLLVRVLSTLMICLRLG